MSDRPAHRRRWIFVVGGLALAGAAVVIAFRWDWFIPLVEARASAALDRQVRIGHLNVELGAVTRIVAGDVSIANPAGWQGGGNFATADQLIIELDVAKLLHGDGLILPMVCVIRPVVDAQQRSDRMANWTFGVEHNDNAPAGSRGPRVGALIIDNGSARVRSTPLTADFDIKIDALDGSDGARTVASATGTYAGQPITADFESGALLSVTDATAPFPVKLSLRNGPTAMSATGSIRNPLAFQGADLRLELSGPNMALLLPLIGIAIPKTPPYRVAGQLDYTSGEISFEKFSGVVGSTDLEGTIKVQIGSARPVVNASLQSQKVDLKDLGGFIGAEPGDAGKGTKREEQGSGRVLPDTPISLPKLNVADVHLTYRAQRIEGRRQPLDNMQAVLDIVDGNIDLHPLSFGIGSGRILSEINLVQQNDALRAKANVNFERVDVSKLLNATGIAHGAGSIGGQALIQGTGKSLGQILANGDGEIRLYMGSGGDLSALLVDLSGLQFGNALLSALGIPNRSRVQCFITDFALKDGLASSRLTMLDTDEARVGVTGQINLRTEALNLTLRTESKHFNIGSLPAPIGIDGTLGSPSIQPDLAEAGGRAAAAVGLGVALTPLAGLLPTIQLGTGEDGACAGLLREIKASPRAHPDRSNRRNRR